MRVFGRLTLLFVMVLSGPANAAGALAIDTNHGSHFGYSYGYARQGDANRRAIQECGAHGCHVVVQFRHACAAYAADQTRGSTAYGWGIQSSRFAAQNRALAECAVRGGRGSSCIIRVWGCDP
jgi:Domain of unknown function (DUF4189)